MTAPRTPKASPAAVEAVQEALGCGPLEINLGDASAAWCQRHHISLGRWDERGCPVAVAAADAAAPHNAATALREAADDAERFAAETYALDIFRKPTDEDYAAINALLQRERGHMLDGVAADCYRRAIILSARRLRESAFEIEQEP